jgi:hypothetical protein
MTEMFEVVAETTVEIALEGDPLKRYEWAVLLGLDGELAYRVAVDEHCDLHRVHELLSRSCPPVLAVQLATPVR